MLKKEIINYWINSSDKDFEVMVNLYKNSHYSWALFIGHLVIEKLIKAYFVKNNDENVPLIHNLVRLGERANL